MKYGGMLFQILTVVTFLFLTSGTVRAMTLDEAFEKLDTHKFGQNYQVLEYLREAVVTSHSDPTTRKKLNDGFTHILDSDASYDAKQFACRQLALTATEEHIPVLARHLGDEKMTHMALYVLTHIDSPEVDEALLSALETTTGNARLGIINMLGNRRCADAVEPLGRFAISGDEDTSIAAIRALGRIGTIAARRQLFFHDIIYDPPKKHSHAKEMAFAHAELDFGDRLAADGKVRQAIDRYRSAFSEDNPAHIRAAGLKGLVTSLGEHARRYGFTAEAWGSDSRELYGMAAALVRIVPDKKTAEAMVAGLPELGPSVQVLLIGALAARDDSAGAAFVRAACESHDVHVKQAAIRALGKIGVISSVPLLIAQAAHGAHQDAALESLTDMVGDNVNGVLIGLLHDSDGTEKAVICRVLLGRNATEAASALINVARTGDPATRAEAIKALHSLAGPRQMPALVDLVFTVEPAEADQIGKALVAVARRNSMQRVCTQGILSKYDQDVNADRRVVLLMTLGELGDEQALSVLRDSLKDDSSQVRYGAIKALSVWPDAAPADDLLEVAESAEDPAHRVLALRGLIDLVHAAGLASDRKLAYYRKAMEVARQDAEKRKVLSVLASFDTLGAFKMAISQLDNPSFKNEAALAACQIAQKIYTSEGRQIKDDLERIVQANVAASTKQQARDILRNIDAPSPAP